MMRLHQEKTIRTLGRTIASNTVTHFGDVTAKTQKQIQNMLEYYTKKPKKFDKVYEQVSEKIVKLEEEYEKSIDKTKMRSTSGCNIHFITTRHLNIQIAP